MGDEISKTRFSRDDYLRFGRRLEQETDFVRELFAQERFGNSSRRLGYELELCLLNETGEPSPCNREVLQHADNPHFTVELARFNLEINGNAFAWHDRVFDDLEQDMRQLYAQVSDSAAAIGCGTGLFGVLPSLTCDHLERAKFMSDLSRYRLLDKRVMEMRGRPVHLDIHGQDHLQMEKNDVMLEALGTSLQIHYQVPFAEAVDSYHAALWSSLAVVGACANSPLVLGARGWRESRIVIFKQAVDSRNPQEIHDRIKPRVHLAQHYIASWMELFEDNLNYSPILPEVLHRPVSDLHHFNLHNGTIWRWVRPILGSSPSGHYHLRLELRVTPAGPTLADSLANLVFQIGLVEGLKLEPDALTLVPYAVLEQDFYTAARQGLSAEVSWCNGKMGRLRDILLRFALPSAERGLQKLGIQGYQQWLDIIHARVDSQRTGAEWILAAWAKQGDANQLVQRYMQHATNNQPVHLWPDFE
jgi:gamma-glutamyl:cysteine ligase YbdK (ATP-grasp superfamily)